MKNKSDMHAFHLFFAYVGRLRIPEWVFYIFLFLFLGTFYVAVNWNVIQKYPQITGRPLFLGAIFPAGTMALFHFATSISPLLFDGYLGYLLISEERIAELRRKFVSIGRRDGNTLVLIGAVIGAIVGYYLSLNPEQIASFAPLFAVGNTSLIFSLSIPATYFVVRQLIVMNEIFRNSGKLNIWDLDPVYAYSRFTAIIGSSIFLLTTVSVYLVLPRNFSDPFFVGQSILFSIIVFAIFFFPLMGVSRKISQIKEKRLSELGNRIKAIYDRIHEAQDNEDFSVIRGLNEMLSVLEKEKNSVKGISSYPWKTSTIRGFLSTLLIPTLLSILNVLLERILE